MSHDLTVLQKGELSDFSFEGDTSSQVENLVQDFIAGSCDPIIGDATTIFQQPLSILKCGLIVREKDLSLISQVTWKEDIDAAMRIGTHFRFAKWGSGCVGRIAPILFDNSSKDRSIDKALINALEIVVNPIFVSTDTLDFRFVFINGTDALVGGTPWVSLVEEEGSDLHEQRLDQLYDLLPAERPHGMPVSYTHYHLDDVSRFEQEVKGAVDVFSYLKDPRLIIPAFSPDQGYGYSNNPVFYVGLTPSGRIAGFMTSHL